MKPIKHIIAREASCYLAVSKVDVKIETMKADLKPANGLQVAAMIAAPPAYAVVATAAGHYRRMSAARAEYDAKHPAE